MDANEPVEAARWTVTNPGGRAHPPTANGAPSSGGFVISDSDFGGQSGANETGSGQSHDLWSPIFSCAGMSEVWLHFDVSAQLNNNGEAVFDIDVSDDAGKSWTTVFRRVAPSRTGFAPRVTTSNAGGYYGRLDVDIAPFAAESSTVRVRFRHFEPNWDWWIAIDNVLVDDVPPAGAIANTEVLLAEDFAGGIPDGWTIDGLNPGEKTWSTRDPCERSIAANGGAFPHHDGRAAHRLDPPFAIVDSDCDPDPEEDELLVTPVLDCSALETVVLQYSDEIVHDASATCEVLLSLDGGATFEAEPIFSYGRGALIDPGEDTMFAERAIAVTRAARQRRVAFAFRYASPGNAWWWAIDDVRVTGVRSGPVDGGPQLPGDANQDGRLDLSDPVRLFVFLFAGGVELPCGDGTAGDAGNVELMSANGDPAVDISDGIFLLQFLFSGGPPHAGGTECVRIPGCPERCEG